MSATLRGLVTFGLDFNYINNFFDAIENVNSERLHQLANKYFIEDKMLEVVVG